MTTIADVLEDIVANGGNIIDYEHDDDVVKITYKDSSGNTVTKTYKRTISDTDGTENWSEVA